LQDVNLSVDLTATFRLTARRKVTSSIDMSVNVLTASNWPTLAPSDVALPSEIVELQAVFTEFYCGKHANRKLVWEPFLGHCLVEGHFEKGSKDFTMSMYQVSSKSHGPNVTRLIMPARG
jgi:cullin-4